MLTLSVSTSDATAKKSVRLETTFKVVDASGITQASFMNHMTSEDETDDPTPLRTGLDLAKGQEYSRIDCGSSYTLIKSHTSVNSSSLKSGTIH